MTRTTTAANGLEPRKRRGAWYTDPALARLLVADAVRRSDDRILDPSCGDGAFLVAHEHAVGVERDAKAAAAARANAPRAHVMVEDFFTYASGDHERFDVACGNPPFIRYQRFSGEDRASAAALCASMGVSISALASSWVPFLIAASGRLKDGGRMAFVVPAEIGHAPYAAPLLRHLAHNFGEVRIIAVRERLFPETSEDCWLLLADRHGESTDAFSLVVADGVLDRASLRGDATRVPLLEWEEQGQRLRPFLLPAEIRTRYRVRATEPDARRLADCAKVGIGYVTGDNDFFHLRPSEAAARGIPDSCLRPAVRNGRALADDSLTADHILGWRNADQPYLLLHLDPATEPPRAVHAYLESPEGERARRAYKCRIRDPWWAVPHVRVPDGFLTSLNGVSPRIVLNHAKCVATNSVHEVHCRPGFSLAPLQRALGTALAQLSTELEGHPLGGGLLKLEPREAGRVLLPGLEGTAEDDALFAAGVAIMRRWRRLTVDRG